MKKNNKFPLGAVWSGKEGSVHHRKSNMTVCGSNFAFGVVKQPFAVIQSKYMGGHAETPRGFPHVSALASSNRPKMAKPTFMSMINMAMPTSIYVINLRRINKFIINL